MVCDACGCEYQPAAEAWSTRCGTCIAAELELSLMRPALDLSERKPLRRATAAVEPEVADVRKEQAA